jgi:DNA helicase-2/ATP-dependent DNA helicase PcrA
MFHLGQLSSLITRMETPGWTSVGDYRYQVMGLDYPVVFLADVNARKFPSNYATRQPKLLLDAPILRSVDPSFLADNANRDGERRLMYVALTRAASTRHSNISSRPQSGQVKRLFFLLLEFAAT